ncbi:sporulation membrane protein YtaF [Clostridium thermobutyricum]|uniref:Manganese efflux pump MntP n=1 Tax=Clostridium thermobutyricum DSM 4928 TaxID=1121339 RepID=A0A1V4SXP1_9CLOT|nr:sporulation membrane protein YtaF [Clostridium thermobutyricum]OPX49316.1 manganese efflux pump MntP [Clostridium thermobutyricum DSM 4928]
MSIFILVISLILDSFVTSIAYGSDNIKIPNSSIILINFISALMLTLAILFGISLMNFIPEGLPNKISFVIFFSLGLYKLFEVLIKKYFKKFSLHKKPLTFKAFDMNFALNVYIDEKSADFDKSKAISLKESVYLSLALSLDSLAVGIGISFMQINYVLLIVLCFILGVLSFKFGILLGKKLVSKREINLSWLSGLILLLISFTKL